MDRVRWLRISYWTGAIADALAAIPLLFPALYVRLTGMRGIEPARVRHGMGYGAVLMLGWTAILIWADRRPLARRGVLPIAIAVILGMVANNAVAVVSGSLPLTNLLLELLPQAALIALFVYSYVNAGRRARARVSAGGDE